MFGADVSFLRDSKLNSTNEKIVLFISGLHFNCFFFFLNNFRGPLAAVCSVILASPVRFLHLSLNLIYSPLYQVILVLFLLSLSSSVNFW